MDASLPTDIQQLAGWTWRVAKSTYAKDGLLGAILALKGDRIEGINLVGSREGAGAVKFERTSNPGVVRVLRQSGQPLDWQFIAYGDGVVFFDGNRGARLLTRVAQREKPSETAAKTDRSGSIVDRLASVVSGSGGSSVVGKWQGSNLEIEFFEDNTLVMKAQTGAMAPFPANGKWLLLSDGRLKLDIQGWGVQPPVLGTLKAGELVLQSDFLGQICGTTSGCRLHVR